MMTTVLRSGILAAAGRDEVERFIRDSRWSRALVARFVAGDRLEDALVAATRLREQGLAATLDRLGENVVTPVEARGAVES
jgi:proline dehydrogenase